MRWLAPSFLFVAVLAGCVAPITRNDGAAPGLPSSLDVDLHDHRLNITMPAGQPSIMVTLNVTSDMWIRPHFPGKPFGAFPSAPAPVNSLRDDSFWTLCPRVQAVGLAGDVNWVAYPFWLKETHLVPAYGLIAAQNPGNSTASSCVGVPVTLAREFTIRANVPFNGTLVLLLAAQVSDPLPGESQAFSAAFRFLVGIATDCKDDSAKLCVPAPEVPAQPAIRGGLPVQASQFSERDGNVCQACGFEVNDQRSQTAGVPNGKLSAIRRTDDAPGLTFVVIQQFRTGVPADLSVAVSPMLDATLDLRTGDASVVNQCSEPGAPSIWAIISHHRRAVLNASFDSTGGMDWYAAMTDTPLDISQAGWTMQATAIGWSNNHLQNGIQDGFCQ